MGERRLLSADLVVRREWADCDWCEKPRHKCVCDAARAITSYGTPAPADLLTDPRVRALVEALSGAAGTLADHGSWQASEAAAAALAPFEEVPVAKPIAVILGGAAFPASITDLAAHLLATEAGPKPWRDGDERCHCTHCDACGRLYRTADIWRHREVCPVAAVAHALRDLQAGVPRVG